MKKRMEWTDVHRNDYRSKTSWLDWNEKIRSIMFNTDDSEVESGLFELEELNRKDLLVACICNK